MLNLIKTEKIKIFIKENNLSIKEFCDGTKINYCVFRRIMGQKNFMISALFKIAKFMNVHVHELFSDEKLSEEEKEQFRELYCRRKKRKQ